VDGRGAGVIAFALLLLASPPGPDAAAWSRVAAIHRQGVEEAGIVGSSLLVVRDGKVAHHQEVGFQDAGRRQPVTPETIFHWASITKTLTGIAILQLRDQGLLSLDDAVVDHVPELRAVHSDFGPIAQVKIRHLMSHSAGFRGPTWPWGGDQPWHPYEPTEWAQLVAMLPYTRLEFAPGSRYSYSNPGVIFLGRIVETLSGDDFEVYVAKNIFMPLGMHASFFDRAPRHLLGQRSHSFVRDGAGLREQRFDFDTGITVSNGGLNAPLSDMARYVAFLLGQGGLGVLKRSSLEEMWVPQVKAAAGEGTSAAGAQAALSFFVERHGDRTLVAHSGDQNGFLAHLYLDPASRTGWLLAFNTNTAAAGAVDAAVRDAVLRELLGPAPIARPAR
jgi:CubicO group peptidase (beta-lactamase class C family)